jgi:formylglycine-generating enzyme required for sulfatase activity
MHPTLPTLAAAALVALVPSDGSGPASGSAQVQAVEAPEIAGFEFLGLETFRCGGRTNTVPVYLHGKTGLEFVLVPGGRFWMGAEADGDDTVLQARPRRQVSVEPFLLARTEVSNGLFRAWRPDYESGAIAGIDLDLDELPAGLVGWDDAVAWCEEHGLRLPSEAEWEYACRAGTESTRFWGDGEEQAGRYANLADRALEAAAPDFVSRARTVRGWSLASTQDGHAGPAPCGSFAPNAFGLFDMLGNVAEHCADRWHGTYSGAPPTGRVWSDAGTASRVNRGAAWDSPFELVRCAWRGVTLTRSGPAGVRPALSLPDDLRQRLQGDPR